MYQKILNKFYQNTLIKAKQAKEEYENLKPFQVTSRAFLQGKISAYSEILTYMRLLSEEAEENKKESSD